MIDQESSPTPHTSAHDGGGESVVAGQRFERAAFDRTGRSAAVAGTPRVVSAEIITRRLQGLMG